MATQNKLRKKRHATPHRAGSMSAITRRWVRGEADEIAARDGCWFDEAAADKVRQFFRKFLRHSKDPFAGQPFELLDWQWNEFIGPLFGWKRADGTRRFRRGSLWVPKKNGKSTLCAGIALYMLLGDGESGAEVFTAAVDKDQASVIFNEAANMAEQSPELMRHLDVRRSVYRIAFQATYSYLQALSADVKSKEGKNASCVVTDELHAHKSHEMFSVLRYAGALRSQPLNISISTAGDNKTSIGYEQYEYAKRVLLGPSQGGIVDTSYFALVYEAPEDADWTQPATWELANPSWGKMIRAEEMAEVCQEARNSPRLINKFRRYRLNQWVEGPDRWLSDEDWAKGSGPIDWRQFIGRPCYPGLDHARRHDIAAAVAVFPSFVGDASGVGGQWHFFLKPYFWIPKDIAAEKEAKDRVPYRLWASQGMVTLTPGDLIDDTYIRETLRGEVRSTYQLKAIGFDPNWSQNLCEARLRDEDGIEVIGIRQTFDQLHFPTKEFEEALKDGRIHHGDHPVLSWMARNACIREDATGRYIVSKSSSTARIDGIAAAIFGFKLAVAHREAKPSYYEDHGVMMIGVGEPISEGESAAWDDYDEDEWD